MQNTATASFPWVLFVLGLGLLAFIYGAISYWRSMRARQVCLSPEDKQEWAGMPLTAAQRIAWLGLTLGLLEIAGLTAWVISMGGATVYWDDDSFRLSVSGVFVFCLVSQAILMSLAVSKADERGKQSLRGAPQTQVVALMLTFVATHIYLGQAFHDAGAVPMVYNYFSFGYFFMVYMTSWFMGVLVSDRVCNSHGQG